MLILKGLVVKFFELGRKLIKLSIRRSELFRGASIAFIGKLLGMFLGYIFVLLISRLYGAETMGLYSLAFTVLNILAMLGCLGFDTALVKFVALYKGDNNLGAGERLCRESIVLSVSFTFLLSAFALFFYQEISQFLFEAGGELYLFVAIACAPFVVFSRLASAIFRGLKDISVFSLINNIFPYLFSSIALIVIYFNTNVHYAPVCALLLGYVLTSMYGCSKLSRYLHGELVAEADRITLSQGVRIAFPMLLTSSMTLMLGWADVLMLGAFTDEEVVGVYSIVVKLAMLSSIVLMAVTTIAAPKFSELHGAGKQDELVTVVSNTTKLICLATFPIVAAMFFLGGFILGIFGEDFVLGKHALQILLIGQLVNSVCGPVGQFMNMTGHQKYLQLFAGVSLVVNLSLNYILIQQYQALGAAIATAASGILWNCMCVVFVFCREKILLVYIPFWSR